MKIKELRISKKAHMDMSFILVRGSDSLLAAVFASLPLPLKRHCIQTGAAAGIMATHAPKEVIPHGIPVAEYANAVRYGGFYHDIGAFAAYNHFIDYPIVGERLLTDQLDDDLIGEDVRNIIIETVKCAKERYNGKGYPNRLAGQDIPFHAAICGIADSVDLLSCPWRGKRMNAEQIREYINEQTGVLFAPEAVACFETSRDEIASLYKHWKVSPPCWKYSDLKPIHQPYERVIG